MMALADEVTTQVMARLPLFQNLEERTAQRLAAMIVRTSLAKGQTLFAEGDEADAMFVLLRGKVKLTRLSHQPQPAVVVTGRGRPMIPAARESLLGLVGPGEMVGELSVLDGGHRSTTARAMLDCDLVQLPAAGVRALMTERHDLSLAMVHQLAHRIRMGNENSSHLVLGDVPGRLAWVLLSLADRFGTAVEGGIEVHHDLTQAELAQMVGASRETVNKVLTDFVDRKWISSSGRTVVIREVERLRQRTE